MSGCSVSALPASSPKPCTTLSTPGGSPASRQISASSVAVSGRPFRRLVHHRAAGRERGRDLPGREHERRVPGRDHAHRADRLAHRVVEMRVGRQRQPVGRIGRAVGIEAEILRAAQRRLASCSGSAGRYRCIRRSAISSARASMASAILCRSSRRSSPVTRGSSWCGTPWSRLWRRGRSRPRRRARPWRSRVLSTGEAVSKVVPPLGIRLAVDQVRHGRCRGSGRGSRPRARWPGRAAAHAAFSALPRMVLRRKVRCVISWISMVSASGCAA